MAERQVPADRLPGHHLLLGAEAEEGARRASTRSIPSSGGRSRSSASRSSEQKRAGGRRRGRGVRQRLGGDDVQGASSAELGIIFCSFSEAVREHPDLVRKYLGSVVPYTDNFFAALNSAVFSDGSFCYVPKGVRCPMELSTYFRINAAEHRPVRAHADRRRGGRVRQLPRGLHGADARREPAARGGRRAGRARQRARSSTRRCRTGIRATRTARAASTTS